MDNMERDILDMVHRFENKYYNVGRQDAISGIDRRVDIQKKLTDRFSVPGAEEFTGHMVARFVASYINGHEAKEVH